MCITKACPYETNIAQSDGSDTDSDTDSDDSDAQKKIFVKINPLNQVTDRSHLVASPDILSQVGKSLKLNSSSSTLPHRSQNRPMSPLLTTNGVLDENNNELTAKPKTQTTTTTTTTQTISVSVYTPRSSLAVPPPLPPLPPMLQQKAKEQQKLFQQQEQLKTTSTNKTEPISIHANGPATGSSIKIIKKNVEVCYDSSRSSVESSVVVYANKSNKTLGESSSVANTASSAQSANKIHLNITIPASATDGCDEEMQF